MTQRIHAAVSPSTNLTAFSCPHCGALTTQHWRQALVPLVEKDKLPTRVQDLNETAQLFRQRFQDRDEFREMMSYALSLSHGLPFVGDRYHNSTYSVGNVDFSQCYNCDKLALWVNDQIVWPYTNEAPQANDDLPHDALLDYEEAGQIVGRSPRGAAALLRLVIQKLCKHLGESGDNINSDIKSLVAKGLDPRVQQALDVVRVVGNNAVHPGQIDLRDDRSTADKLFTLVNLICDVMISQPKHVTEMFEGLPAEALAQIERRDKSTKLPSNEMPVVRPPS